MLSYYPQQRFSSFYPVASAPAPSSRDRYLAALAEAKAAEEEYLREQALQQEELALRRRLEEIQLRKRQNDLRHIPQRASYSEPAHFFPGFDVFDYSHVVRQRQIEEENQRQALAARQANIQAYRQKQLEQEILRNQQCRRLSGCFLDGNNVQKPSAAPLARRPACRRAQVPKDRPEDAVEIDLDQILGQMFGLPIAQKPTALASHIRRAHSVPTSQPTKKSASEIPVPIPAPASQRSQPQPRREVPVQRTHSDSSLPGEVEVDLAQNFEDFLKLLGIAPAAEPQQPRASTSSPATSSTSSSKTVPAPAKAAEKVAPAAPSKASEPTEQTLKKELEARLNNEYETEVRDTIQALIASLQDSHAPSETQPTPASPSSASDKGKAKAADEGSFEPTSKDVANSMNEVSSIETAFVGLESDFTIPAQLDFDLSTASFDDTASVHSSDSEGSASTHLAFTSRNHPVRSYEQALSSLLSQLDAIPSFGNEEIRKRRKEVVSKIEKALDDLEWEVQGRWRSKVAKESKAAEDSALSSEPSSLVQETPVATEELKEEAKEVDVAQEQAPEEQAPESVLAASEPSAPASTTSESESQDLVAPASEPVEPVVETVEELAQEVPEPVSDEQEEIVPAASEPQEEIAHPAESVVVEEEIPAPAAEESVASPVEEVVVPEPSAVASTPEVVEEPESSYPPRSLADSEPSSGSSSLATSTATIKLQPYEVETDSEVDEVESISEYDDVDTYLLPSSAQPEVQRRPRHDDDSASEWSEIEA